MMTVSKLIEELKKCEQSLPIEVVIAREDEEGLWIYEESNLIEVKQYRHRSYSCIEIIGQQYD